MLITIKILNGVEHNLEVGLFTYLSQVKITKIFHNL